MIKRSTTELLSSTIEKDNPTQKLMETTLFKPLSESQKAEIIDAIVNSDEDVELVLNYLSRCTPYQIAEWYENWATKTATAVKRDKETLSRQNLC